MCPFIFGCLFCNAIRRAENSSLHYKSLQVNHKSLPLKSGALMEGRSSYENAQLILCIPHIQGVAYSLFLIVFDQVDEKVKCLKLTKYIQLYTCMFSEAAQRELCQWSEEWLEMSGDHPDQTHINVPALEGIVC